MYCNKFWLFRLLIKKMEFEIKKEYKSYASGSFFYVDSYQNKLTKSFKSEGMVNTNVINNYIVHPMEIERLIEEFTMKLIEREKKTAFIRIEEPCMYQNVVVTQTTHDSGPELWRIVARRYDYISNGPLLARVWQATQATFL